MRSDFSTNIGGDSSSRWGSYSLCFFKLSFSKIHSSIFEEVYRKKLSTSIKKIKYKIIFNDRSKDIDLYCTGELIVLVGQRG
jgi:hypothetical protein